MRVLIAIDGGPVSEDVLARVGAMLAPADEIHVVSVIDPDEVHSTFSAHSRFVVEDPLMSTTLGAAGGAVRPIPAEDVTQAAERVDIEHREVVEALAKRALPSSLSWTVHVRTGAHPAAVILDFARELEADTIAVGTRARRDIVQALLGSVAEEVIRGTTLPVIVIHTGTHG